MARTGSSTVSTETRVFQSDHSAGGTAADGPPARAIRVNCDSASAVSLKARIPSLHGSASVIIPAGQFREFVNFDGATKAPAIHDLYLSGNSGTATYTFEVIG